jgi:toxin ParE1/3/4
MNLQFSSRVEFDLEEIAEWIAQDNPWRAVTFVVELRQEIQRIGRNPRLFRLRPEIGPEVRAISYGSYVILFTIREDAVRIERVVHGRRDLPRLLE